MKECNVRKKRKRPPRRKRKPEEIIKIEKRNIKISTHIIKPRQPKTNHINVRPAIQVRNHSLGRADQLSERGVSRNAGGTDRL
jgi:hypothetical protein